MSANNKENIIDIQKDYMSVNEVAKSWNVPIEDIRYLGEEGELTICIRRIPVRVAVESILEKYPYVKNLPNKAKEIIKLLDYPQPLHPTDIYLIFSNPNKKIKITRFKTMPVMNIIKIQSPEIEVGFDDMIITASELKRFEFEHGNFVAMRDKDKEPLVLLSGDFSYIRLYGEEYRFGGKQAVIIQHLYDKYSAGDPWVHGKTLLRQANSESMRLANLFNHHPNWRKAILSNGRGQYRMNLPFAEPASNYLKAKNNDLPLFSFLDEEKE